MQDLTPYFRCGDEGAQLVKIHMELLGNSFMHFPM